MKEKTFKNVCIRSHSERRGKLKFIQESVVTKKSNFSYVSFYSYVITFSKLMRYG